jgi:two-component system, NtrC family, sensor histidine kinase HydH
MRFARIFRRDRDEARRGRKTSIGGEAMWTKVIAPTALVSLLWIAVSCGTSYYLSYLDGEQTKVLNANRIAIQAAGGMRESLWRLQAVVLEAIEQAEKNGVVHPGFQEEAQSIERAFAAALQHVDDTAITTVAEREVAQRIETNFSQYRRHVDRWLVSVAANTTSDDWSVEESMRLARAVTRPCEELFELGQRLTAESFARRDRLRVKVDMLRLSFVILGPAVGILLGARAARGLHRSLSQISVTLRDASGDLEQEIGRVEIDPDVSLGGLPALERLVQDVSGRIRQVVDELQKTRLEAVRAERLAAVGELAAGVAHELRNPLTSVKLLIQMMAQGAPDVAHDRKRLGVVEQEISRMETIIQELLDFARPPKLRRVQHDLLHTLGRALNLVEGKASQARVQVVPELGQNPLLVDGDPEQLDQVFINLLLNGIEAMPDGGQLRVVAERAAAADGAALARVLFCDTGLGIPGEIMRRLFEPFVTSKERGIGLGLAISSRIVDEHGGRLIATNQSVGATFTVELPLVVATAATCPPADGVPVKQLSQSLPELSSAQTASH